MENQTSQVKTCVLKVGIKCCNGCQTNAKRKLLNVAGVSAVEYNAEQGLLRVSGDVNPTMLLHKLTKWGKKAELVSFLEDNSNLIPRTPQQNQSKTMETKTTRPTKCCLLSCFGNRRSKAKVEPLAMMPNLHYGGVGAENVSATPFINVGAPPMVYPPPQAMPGFASPIPYPPPYFGNIQSPPYTGGGMFPSVPPQSPPCFQLRQTEFPRMVNSRLQYYPHH